MEAMQCLSLMNDVHAVRGSLTLFSSHSVVSVVALLVVLATRSIGKIDGYKWSRKKSVLLRGIRPEMDRAYLLHPSQYLRRCRHDEYTVALLVFWFCRLYFRCVWLPYIGRCTLFTWRFGL